MGALTRAGEPRSPNSLRPATAPKPMQGQSSI